MLSKGLQNFMYRHFVGTWDSGNGGYPPDIAFLPGHVVVAALDPGKDYYAPELKIYTNKEVRAWHKKAKQWFKQEDLAWDDAVYEAEPYI